MDKVCATCGITKDQERDFYRKGGYYTSPCKDCSKSYEDDPVRKEAKRLWAIEYRAKNSDKLKARYKEWRTKNPDGPKEQYLKYKFNMSLKQYYSMLKSQNGTCAICKGTEKGPRRLSVDHDHTCCPGEGKTCGKCVRGIVCQRCNTVLGCSRDNPTILDSAKDYLRQYA